jgi:hypothetical protein
MSRRDVWLAWSVCALCVALAAGSFLLALFSGRTPGEILVDEGIGAVATLAAFSARLREETDLDALGDDLVGVVTKTLQAAHASLWQCGLRLEDSEAQP